MSIAKLKKVTIAGIAREKTEVLDALQTLGVLHLIDISPQPLGVNQVDPFKNNREALAYLEDCPQRQRPLRRRPKQFDPDLAIAQVLRLKARQELLKDDTENIQNQIALMKPWGNFQPPSAQELYGLHLFFYIIPHRSLKKITEANLAYQVVNQDSRSLHVVVVHDSEPDLPFTAIAMPQTPLAQLQEELENTLDELEKCDTRRFGETRLIDLLRSHLNYALDNRDLTTATFKTYDDQGLFALQGWCSIKLVNQLQDLVQARSLALEINEPSKDENPPTYIENHPLIAPGETLIGLYGVPAYHSWDPSMLVYFSFIIFFAMILSDAGYALIMLGLTFFLRSKLLKSGQRSLFLLFLALSISSTFYGVISGTYFGWTPPEGNFLHYVMIFDSTDLKNLSILMAASILIGCVHICIANLISLYNYRHSQKAIACLGWIIVIIAGYTGWLAQYFWQQPALANSLLGVLGGGLLLVVLFSHPAPLTLKGIISRLGGGFEGLLHISKVFGDILSYLRIFALGLSSSYLAITFNQLAHDAYQIKPVGFLLSFFIILLGHTVNFALGIMGGVIHGLRLNFIEFYGWSLKEEGFLFNPFRKNVKN